MGKAVLPRVPAYRHSHPSLRYFEVGSPSSVQSFLYTSVCVLLLTVHCKLTWNPCDVFFLLTASLCPNVSTATQRSVSESAAPNERILRSLECRTLCIKTWSICISFYQEISKYIYMNTIMWELRSEFFAIVTMKNAVFWDAKTCGFLSTDFSETYRLHYQGEKSAS
jgi:hypothetical protein